MHSPLNEEECQNLNGFETQYVQSANVTDMKTALWRVLLASKSNK